ncbi:exported hypothetical protein [Sulfurovum sp. enrichment culture clone C5]|uniref:General secretion pathway protein M n=1 Tax=Sulfurovum sp. enrichment culture clone C5 TaxID=497650 RepID=A0A0S4XRG4_9BACT|nr:exported hypothetical protein [Sulfurovum sp. enrichment culture clone C5]
MKQYLFNYKTTIASIVFLFFSWAIKIYFAQEVIEQKSYNTELSQEIEEASSLQRIWASNTSIPQRLDLIKAKIPTTKVKSFQKTNQSLSAVFIGLNISEVEYTINEIVNLPVQIKDLNVENTPNGHNVKLVLKW